jgi:hypothetical protein
MHKEELWKVIETNPLTCNPNIKQTTEEELHAFDCTYTNMPQNAITNIDDQIHPDLTYTRPTLSVEKWLPGRFFWTGTKVQSAA